jgi:Mg-chelatase subunit ChlD
MMGSEACDKFPVLVRVTAAPWRHAGEMPRDGVDVVVMLDINRNMQVERLERVKQAMLIMIDKLGRNDRLSIVLLKSDTHRLMELTYMSDDHGRDAARFKISQLKVSSGTYMCHSASAALQEGAQVYMRVHSITHSKHPSRCKHLFVFLLRCSSNMLVHA